MICVSPEGFQQPIVFFVLIVDAAGWLHLGYVFRCSSLQSLCQLYPGLFVVYSNTRSKKY